MKKGIAVLTSILLILASTAFAQTDLKEYKAGHVFNISLPGYMSKTSGLNSSSAIEYKSIIKDVYGFVIFDTKEELRLAEMEFSSINEFYEFFIKDFLKDEEKRKVTEPKFQRIGETNFLESDATFYDKDTDTEIYYLVGIVETNTSFYKVLSWSGAENKDKFKADFQKIIYSLKD